MIGALFSAYLKNHDAQKHCNYLPDYHLLARRNYLSSRGPFGKRACVPSILSRRLCFATGNFVTRPQEPSLGLRGPEYWQNYLLS
jgi:hypothetical protein